MITDMVQIKMDNRSNESDQIILQTMSILTQYNGTAVRSGSGVKLLVYRDTILTLYNHPRVSGLQCKFWSVSKM